MFELAARSALVAYGVPPAVALSAGLVLHAVSALPFIALGAVGMARLGVSGARSGPRRRRAPDLRGLRAPMTPTNVLLTCAGMRGDMVAAFQAALAREGAGGVVVAADSSRLAPTLYLADRSALVPRGRRPGYVATLLALCEQHAHPRGAAADRPRPGAS